jgi:hypothetical protein
MWSERVNERVNSILTDERRMLIQQSLERLEGEIGFLKGLLQGMPEAAPAPQVTPSPLTEDDYTIDCSATPFIPNDLTYRESDQIPSLVKDVIRISKDPIVGKAQIEQMLTRIQHPRQTKGRRPSGHEVKEYLSIKPPYSAHLGDFLKLHPELVPDCMKQGDWTYFWSIYRCGGRLCARNFRWSGGCLISSCCSLGSDWSDDEFAAVRPELAA